MTSKKIQGTPQGEVDRLRSAAKHLEDNPLWLEALQKLEDEYTRAWVNTDPVQQLQRENAYYMVQAVHKLRQQIRSFCQAGALHSEHTRKNVQNG